MTTKKYDLRPYGFENMPADKLDAIIAAARKARGDRPASPKRTAPVSAVERYGVKDMEPGQEVKLPRRAYSTLESLRVVLSNLGQSMGRKFQAKEDAGKFIVTRQK